MRRLFILTTGLLCAVAANSEELVNTKVPSFPTKSYFKRMIEPVPTRVDLKPPAKLRDYIVDGKLELSMRNYLDLVMANNTDVEIQRVTVETSRNQILRASGIFDPLLFASFSATRTESPASDALAGATALNSLTQPTLFRVSQLTPTGATYNASFTGSKSSTNSSFALFNPALTTGLNFNFAQPLLRGRGSFITKLPITIAKSRLLGAQYNLEDQVIQLVLGADSAYWDVVQARESVRVQEQALSLADQSLKRSQRELELGAISPLDIYQPQAVYANAEIQLTQARFRLAAVEDALRKQISVDLDPEVRKLPIVLTESIAPPADAPMDKEKMVDKALSMRADLKFARQSLDVDQLNLRGAKDALRPNLSLTGQYGASGRGGPFSQKTNIFNGDGTTNTIISVVPGGIGDSLDQLFGFGYPVYGFGLTLSLPIRDRRANADYADAIVNQRLDTLRVRTTEQNVRLSVLNAINSVENSKASVDLAKVALDLAQKRADAEQKKYDLGTTTIFFLLDAQTSLTQAQSNLVNSSVNYRKALTTLQRFTGELLSDRGIAIK